MAYDFADTERSLDQSALDQLREVGGDELVRELAGLFLDDLQQRVDALDDAVAAGDYATASGVAHAIKGSCLYLGLTAFADVALRVETQQRANHQTNADALLAEFRSCAVDARRCIEGLVTN